MPGFCHRDDACNFIHSEKHKGCDIPREDFYKLRAENQQRFQILLYSLNPSLVQMNGLSEEWVTKMKEEDSQFLSYSKSLLYNVRLYESNRQSYEMQKQQTQ